MSIQRSMTPHKRLSALSYAHRLWEAIDTPISLSCHILASNGEFRQLVEMDIDPSNYRDPLSFAKDHQAVKLLARYPYLETGIDTEAVAKRKFIEAELQCRATNERFRNPINDASTHRVQRILLGAQRKIERILGDVPELSKLDFSFGPGAAYGVRGDTSVFNKVSSTLECTYALADILPEFLAEFPGWLPAGGHDYNLVPGSQLTVVPKNAKTGRPICIEPLLNGLYQKGVGSWIRDRLKRFGVDLNDQSINQKLAGEAFTQNLSTVDFSSASDTIAYLVVMDLLPHPWFEFLDVARSPFYLIDGSWWTFQKFSSMGNAYTFELETLIFYSIACACCEELGIEYQTGVNLSVYGDDVIIPRQAFDLFSEITEYCGFTVNKKKSFKQGSFFESCGHDFFMGKFVRPFLISKKVNTLVTAFYAANNTKRVFKRLKRLEPPHKGGNLSVQLDSFSAVHGWVVSCIPNNLRVVGPEGYGDGHLIDSLSQGEERRHPCWDGWWFHTYSEKPRRVKLVDGPSGYALYFTRGQRSLVDDRASSALLLTDYVQISEPPHNGSGYDVRGASRLARVKVFCHFVWQDLSWNDLTTTTARS